MISCATIRLSLAALIIVYCSSFQAYNDSVINNLFEPAQSWLSSFFHTQESILLAWSFFSSVCKFARIPGIIAAMILSDRIGRRWTTAIGCSFYVVGSIFTTTLNQSRSYWLGIIGRTLMGIGGGSVRTASSLWLIESAPLNRRGLFASLCIAGASLGGLTAYIITLPSILGTRSLWPLATGISCFPIILLLPIIVVYLKESPRFLYLRKNNYQAASQALEFYQGVEHFDETLDDLAEEAQRHTDTVSYLDLIWKNKQLRKPFLLCFVLNMKCLLGAIPMHVYSTELFHMAGLTYTTAAYCTVFAAIPRIVPGFVIPFAIDKMGRRPLLIVGAIGYMICLIVLVVLFLFLSPSSTRGYTVAVISSISWCFDAAFEHNTVATELMPQKARAKAVGICTISGNLMFAVELLLVLPMYHGLGVPWTLSIFIFNTFIWLVFLYRKLPETRMRTFDQIARLFDSDEEEQGLLTE